MAVSLTTVVHTTDAKPEETWIIVIFDGDTGHYAILKGAAY